MEESNESGSSLVISFANDQDVGDYVCEVSSNPPATLRHSVSLIGKKSTVLRLIHKKSNQNSSNFISVLVRIFMNQSLYVGKYVGDFKSRYICVLVCASYYKLYVLHTK